MPKELETRTVKGVEQIFYKGEWKVVVKKSPKATADTTNDVEMSLTIGGLTIKGKARPKTYEKSGRDGYYIWIPQGSKLFGNGNFFIA